MTPTQTPRFSFIVDSWLGRLPWSLGWSGFAIGAAAFLLSLAVFWLAGGIQVYQAMGLGALRLFFPPLVIVYVLVVVSLLERSSASVVQSLRPLIQLADDELLEMVQHACRTRPGRELGAFVAGAAFFLAVEGRFHGGTVLFWASLYYYLTSILMFAVVAWSIYAIITITRLTNVLLRQPLELDIFDVTSMEPIGLQSLSLSLAFIGAIVLSVPSSPYPPASWQNFLIFGLLLVVTVLVFYLNMYGAHRLLKNEKQRQLRSVEARFARAYARLQHIAANSGNVHLAATELNAWATAKQELNQTRTWPYNTEMLRTLFISVLTPIALGLARIIGPLLAGS